MNILKSVLATSIITLSILSCSESGPKDIALGKDQCDNCQMTIADQKYATELITEKGRVYKFDDIICMQDYATSNPDKSKNAQTYVIDYPSGKFIESSQATFITGGNIKSPMNGNTQAYENKNAAQEAANQLGASLTQ